MNSAIVHNQRFSLYFNLLKLKWTVRALHEAV